METLNTHESATVESQKIAEIKGILPREIWFTIILVKDELISRFLEPVICTRSDLGPEKITLQFLIHQK
jgi:hypothetical protein